MNLCQNIKLTESLKSLEKTCHRHNSSPRHFFYGWMIEWSDYKESTNFEGSDCTLIKIQGSNPQYLYNLRTKKLIYLLKWITSNHVKANVTITKCLDCDELRIICKKDCIGCEKSNLIQPIWHFWLGSLESSFSNRLGQIVILEKSQFYQIKRVNLILLESDWIIHFF